MGVRDKVLGRAKNREAEKFLGFEPSNKLNSPTVREEKGWVRY